MGTKLPVLATSLRIVASLTIARLLCFAVKVINLVVGFANLTRVGESSEQVVHFLLFVLVCVRGLVGLGRLR